MKNTNNVIKINGNKLEVRMGHLGLHGQSVFKGFESLVIPSQDPVNNKQKIMSKISRIGRKLPRIGRNESFKFNNKVDFNVQREGLARIGASEVGSIFIGCENALELITTRVLKSIGREVAFKDNLSIRKGKVLENLGFDEFVRIYSDKITILYKNKYANGIDKYNYFKEINGESNLVGATIDGWFINSEGEAELLEIKCSDNINLRSAITEYNKTGNFLENKYFFKYYVQVQIQLACTGLSKGNLFFLVGNEAVNCFIQRDNAFIEKVLSFVKMLSLNLENICNQVKNDIEIDITSIPVEDLSNHINDLVKNSEFYTQIAGCNYRDEFIEFIKFMNLEIEECRDKHLDIQFRVISALQSNIETIEREQAHELSRLTKPIKEELKTRICKVIKEYSLLENINYRFKDSIFSLDTSRRAIKDRFRFLSKDIINNFVAQKVEKALCYDPTDLVAI